MNAPVQSAFGYRAEVDALRAISVLGVFLFHLDIAVFSGGFVGVDVFYVISGYVIFRTVLQEEASGTFSLRNFWRRRICRILPALLLTILVCAALGWWLMTPKEYAEFGNSAISAIFSVSNIYFNDRLQYFGDAVRETPLAHTWSLGVEEQFYLTAPILVLFLVRRKIIRKLLPILGLIVVLSFAYNLFALFALMDERHAFYLPMSRFWEIAVGGCVACWERWRQWELPFRVGLSWLGVGGIVAGMVVIDTNMPFPGFAALLPVCAAALFLAAGLPGNSLSSRLFQSMPLVFIGRISYSTYLFHWPAITFYTIATGYALDAGARVAILIGTLGLAALSWRFVETPFRRAYRRNSRVRPATVLAAMTGALAALAIMLPILDGVPGRMTEAARQAIEAQARNARSAGALCEPLSRLGAVPEAGICTDTPGAERFDYLLWGDSHASMIRSALSARLRPAGTAGVLVTMPDCPALIGIFTSKRKNRAECFELQAHVERLVATQHIPVVVLAGRWANLGSNVRSPGDGGRPKTIYDAENGDRIISFAAALERTIHRITDTGARVVVVGPTPEVEFSVPKMLIRAAQLDQEVPTIDRRSFDRRQAKVLAALANVGTMSSVEIVYPHRQLCNETTCRVTDGNTPLYRDDDHLSDTGSRLVAPAIVGAILGD